MPTTFQFPMPALLIDAPAGTWPAGAGGDTWWSEIVEPSQARDGQIDHRALTEHLLEWAEVEYRRGCPDADLVEFTHGPASYLFDASGKDREERTVLVTARPEPPVVDRDAAYQRGYPVAERLAGRPLDRGHFVSYGAGGLFGPNLFPQDRALNRGWSEEGKAYRALERAAVAGAARSLLFVRPVYRDKSSMPEFLDLGVAAGTGIRAGRFRNRYDALTERDDRLKIFLSGATSARFGDLGEETAAVLLEETADATVVAMGDAGMPRTDGRQDLDLLVIIDGELIAYEVKTRYAARFAGRLTRAGNLLVPRLRRPRLADGDRQGSQPYVKARLQAFVDTDDGYEGIRVRVLAVDFRSMLAQEFGVNDAGTKLVPLSPPVNCESAARRALTQILSHRGYL